MYNSHFPALWQMLYRQLQTRVKTWCSPNVSLVFCFVLFCLMCLFSTAQSFSPNPVTLRYTVGTEQLSWYAVFLLWWSKKEVLANLWCYIHLSYYSAIFPTKVIGLKPGDTRDNLCSWLDFETIYILPGISQLLWSVCLLCLFLTGSAATREKLSF